MSLYFVAIILVGFLTDKEVNNQFFKNEDNFGNKDEKLGQPLIIAIITNASFLHF